MTNTTVTPATTTTPEPYTMDWSPVNPLDYPAAMRAAVAAVDGTREADGTASATLRAVALAAFRGYANQIMPETAVTLASKGPVSKVTVQAMVWGAATGVQAAPAKADRAAHPAFVSLGQYLSRFATVATTDGYGIAALATVDTFNAAETAIKAARTAEREAGELVQADRAARDLDKWIARLPETDRAAIDKALALFTGTSVGQSHAPAFAARVIIPAPIGF